MQFKDILQQLFAQQDLSPQQMNCAMHHIMTGQASDAQIAGFLAALATKGETTQEVLEAVKVMRELSTKVPYTDTHRLVDTVGCGDGSSTFNISTCCTFILAAAGIPVAKHGNRSNTSASGSSDVLAAAGVNLDLTPAEVGECIHQVNLGFLFAPKHHSAMRYAVQARKEMGVRTLFNLIGPLTNPAGAQRQVIGVFSDAWLQVVAEVLAELGSEHVMIVHAEDGLDEISIVAKTKVVEMREGEFKHWQIDPKQFGMNYANLDALLVGSPQQSLAMIKRVLNNEDAVNAAKDIVLLNAGAAFYVSGHSDSFRAGIEQAREVIQSGKALQKLEEFVHLTQSFSR